MLGWVPTNLRLGPLTRGREPLKISSGRLLTELVRVANSRQRSAMDSGGRPLKYRFSGNFCQGISNSRKGSTISLGVSRLFLRGGRVTLARGLRTVAVVAIS